MDEASGRGRGEPRVVVAMMVAALAVAGDLAFRRLGFRPVASALLVAGIILGGWVDLPLLRRKFRLGVNVGGCLIPLAVAGQQALRMPSSAWSAVVAATTVVALACYGLARPVAGRGLLLPWALPGLLGAALALVLAPARAPGVAYVAGTVGPLLGADLPHLPRLVQLGAARMAIGGGGVFDGLIWSGVLAVCLAAGG
jgi:uncharacterized membrane protein